MKSRNLVVATVLALTAAACGTSSPNGVATSGLADAHGATQAPLQFIDGLPVIPFDHAGFRGAVQGPLMALVYRQELRVGYRGVLGCTFHGLTLGVVQNGAKVGDYAIGAEAIDRSGTPGNCRATLPVGALHEGVVSFYVYDAAGNYDSAFGDNYDFVLNYANVIP